MGRYGVFISGEYENLDKDRTKFQDGYNSIVRRLTLGGDVQFSKRILAGLAFDTYGQDGRFKEPGNFEVDSYRFVAYGSFLPIEICLCRFRPITASHQPSVNGLQHLQIDNSNSDAA